MLDSGNRPTQVIGQVPGQSFGPVSVERSFGRLARLDFQSGQEPDMMHGFTHHSVIDVAKTDPLTWRVARYEELSLDRLYAILAARVAVFVVEQDCPYQDLDGLDDCGLHVAAWSGEDVLAYARVLPPGKRFAEPSIGRVLTARAARGSGLGRELMRRSIATASRAFPGQALRISAQQYLERFYTELGFETVSEPYPEDGIPHVEMFRPAASEQ